MANNGSYWKCATGVCRCCSRKKIEGGKNWMLQPAHKSLDPLGWILAKMTMARPLTSRQPWEFPAPSGGSPNKPSGGAMAHQSSHVVRDEHNHSHPGDLCGPIPEKFIYWQADTERCSIFKKSKPLFQYIIKMMTIATINCFIQKKINHCFNDNDDNSNQLFYHILPRDSCMSISQYNELIILDCLVSSVTSTYIMIIIVLERIIVVNPPILGS